MAPGGCRQHGWSLSASYMLRMVQLLVVQLGIWGAHQRIDLIVSFLKGMDVVACVPFSAC